MTGYCDYLIILTLPENITSYIAGLKQKRTSPAVEYDNEIPAGYIAVQQWVRKKPVWVEPIIPKLEHDLRTLPPLLVQACGFRYFDQQEHKTIYGWLQSTPQTGLWFKMLRRFFNMPPFEPNISIAHNIDDKTFQALWPCFRDDPFSAKLTIQTLAILRRETISDDKSFKIFREIPFNSTIDFDSFTTSRAKKAILLKEETDKQQFSLF